MIEVIVYADDGKVVKVRQVSSVKKARVVGVLEFRGNGGAVCYRKTGKVKPGATRTWWWNSSKGRWVPEEPLREIQRPLFGD